MRTQIVLDVLACVGAATVTTAAVGLAAVGAIDAALWLYKRAGIPAAPARS
jgi:hypothetical protein